MTNDTTADTAAVTVSDLRVDIAQGHVPIVQQVNFAIAPGHIMGLIGESGSGKTTVGTAMLGFTGHGTRISQGSVRIGDTDILSLDAARLRRARGTLITYVPQDPVTALNPSLRIGTQLTETLAAHGVDSKAERLNRVKDMLDEVLLPSTRDFLRRYPHELSGGQQQRVTIANGFITRPKVVVLDEPTTGLDVTTQAQTLRMVRGMCEAHQTAGLYVSHDLAVVAGLADRIAVMYAGRLVETGPAKGVITDAGHPYTRGLIAAIPDSERRRTLTTIPGRVAPPDERPSGCAFADRCPIVQPECRSTDIEFATLATDHLALCRRVDASRSLPLAGADLSDAAGGEDKLDSGYLSVKGLSAAYSGKQVLSGIDLHVPRGMVTALVGESGSGKTTIARCVGGLHQEASGEVSVAGQQIPFGSRNRTADDRKAVQYIFQNATEALSPRHTIGEAIAEPLMILGGMSHSKARARVTELLESVALDPRHAFRYPAQLSGGERQRVTVARALAVDPSVLVCDEITSALDVSVQASVLLLLQKLREETELTMLFVTHNLAVVRAVADRVAVLNKGVIVEEGPVDSVLSEPQDDYTRRLLEDAPGLAVA